MKIEKVEAGRYRFVLPEIVWFKWFDGSWSLEFGWWKWVWIVTCEKVSK